MALGTAAILTAFALPAQAADDKTFIETVIGINLEEIQMGQMAQQKSQNADVKAYGATLVTDHTAANEKATAIAQKIGATVPTAPSTEAQTAMSQVSSLSGADFDKSFLQHMVDGHTTAISMFNEKVNDSGAAAEVTAFAKETLPTLQKHLDTAKSLQGSGQASTGG
jgi:putative membrane protein